MIHFAANILAKSLLFQQRRRSVGTFDPSSIHSILFIEMSRLGDVVTTLPVVESFHAACRQADLFVAVDRRYAGLFKLLPTSTDVYELSGTDSISGFRKAIMKLGGRHFDLLCSLSPSARNSLLALTARASRRVGYFDIYGSMTPFLHRSMVTGVGVNPVSTETYFMENISERAAKVCRSLGIPFQPSVQLDIPRAFETKMLQMLIHHGYEPGSLLVVVHPFAGWTYREWPLSRYAAFVRKILEEKSTWVTFIGTKQESDRLVELRRSLQGVDRVVYFDSLNVEELAALIAQAALFVGSDSGPLHLASALRVPAIGLFGPASPALTGPQSNLSESLFHQVECSPCKQEKCIRPENACIELIATNELLQTARSILERTSVARQP